MWVEFFSKINLNPTLSLEMNRLYLRLYGKNQKYSYVYLGKEDQQKSHLHLVTIINDGGTVHNVYNKIKGRYY